MESDVNPQAPLPGPSPAAAPLRLHQTLFSLGLFFVFLILHLIMNGDLRGGYHMRPRDLDCVSYIAMAMDPSVPTTYPFGMRILTPLVVKQFRHGWVPWDFAWYLTTCASLFLSAVIFWRMLRRLFGLDLATANLMVICLLGNWIYSFFQLQIPFFPDPLNNLLWMTALYFLFEKRHWAFLLTVAVGFTNKDVILFLLPLYPLFVFADTRDWKRLPAALARSCGWVLAVVLAYLAFRRGWSHFVHAGNYRLFTAWDKSPIEMLLYSLSKQKDVYYIYQVFHFLWFPFALMLGIRYREHGWRDKLILGSAALFCILLFGRLFATDANRVFVMMLPLVYILAGQYFQRIRLCASPGVMLLTVYLYLVLNYDIAKPMEWQLFLNIVAMAVLLYQGRRAEAPLPVAAGSGSARP